MMQTIFQQTVAARPTDQPDKLGGEKGCLLQMMPLEVDAGLKSIESYPFKIGRDEACQLSIRDTSISRYHCEIVKGKEGFVLRDLGSTNGTVVNDEEIVEHQLIAGDQIRLGNRIYKFMTSDHFEVQYHEAVYSMMTRDSLTGAWNKRYFLDVLTRDLHRGQRRDHPVALVLFDIDFFKRVNDTYGHLAGDEVLAELAQRVQGELRSDEVFARYGGEEFAVILSECELTEAVETAERCRQRVRSSNFESSVGPLTITISAGVAIAPPTAALSPTELIEQADQCLYRAKDAGRDCVVSETDSPAGQAIS